VVLAWALVGAGITGTMVPATPLRLPRAPKTPFLEREALNYRQTEM
jgi:hypothetical protein